MEGGRKEGREGGRYDRSIPILGNVNYNTLHHP